MKLDLTECDEAYEVALGRTLTWCDPSGLVMVTVTGEKDFHDRVRADLELAAVDTFVSN